MKILELSDTADYIQLRQNSILVVIDGLKYLINPQVDKLFYKNKEINIQKIHQGFKLLCKNCYSKHKHKANLYFSPRNNQATAWYTQNFVPNYRTPLCISMCFSFLLNEDDCLFSMAHEFGHFDDYLSKTYDDLSNKKVLEYISFFFMFVLISLSLLLTAFSLNISFKYLPSVLFSCFSVFVIFLFCELINYIMEMGLNFTDTIQDHHNEYKADKFAYNFFNDILIKNVFLYEGKLFHISKSHPSNCQRIVYLNYNIKMYFPLFHFKYVENKMVLKQMLIELIKLMLPKTIANK
jgi:hypothetical protein